MPARRALFSQFAALPPPVSPAQCLKPGARTLSIGRRGGVESTEDVRGYQHLEMSAFTSYVSAHGIADAAGSEDDDTQRSDHEGDVERDHVDPGSLLRTGDLPLSRLAQRWLGPYATSFNRIHRRTGYLFQNRLRLHARRVPRSLTHPGIRVHFHPSTTTRSGSAYVPRVPLGSP